MRRAASALWPALSHLFGLRPWDVGRLTDQEWANYRASAQAWQERQSKG